jgi:hypothetical protein
MPAEFIPIAGVPSAKASQTADDLELPRRPLILMRELEASLHASRKALLALDLAGIEGETREQGRLMGQLEAVLPPGLAPRARGQQPAEDLERVWSAHGPELEEEFRRGCKRILEATRLQAALLARARSKLRVLANMLAGQSVIYGPPGARNSAPLRAFPRKSGGGKSGGGI